MIFDLLSHEYGWTTEQILSITTKELSARMACIYKRREADRIFQASLHDKKLQLNTKEDPEPIELTEKEKETVEKNKALSLERIRKRGK